jgi:YD repeat-containing protein
MATITVNYDQTRLDNIVDTLGRVIEFNYDNDWLSSITQVWNDNTPSELTHTWATFTYANLTIDTNFTGFTVSGPADNSVIKVLTKVTLDDNNRHLPLSINYDTSNTTGVTAVSAVTLAYDGAGNRTSMTDGSGTHAYHYDAQSRLDWEERTFSAIQNSPTYRLSYLYNLGGMLEKVTDEFSGNSISTTLDKTGRPTDVDGNAGSGNESFAADILYRASGAVREMDFGNGLSLSYGYNARWMVTSYAVGTFAGANYQYYSDGKVKFADVLTFDWDEIKDRAYSYDFSGRLAEAYTGAEARDVRDNTTGATPDGSYRRTYAYDQWDNMTSDSGRYWARETPTLATYGTDNRVAGWSYDPEGNVESRNEDAPLGLVFYAATTYTYDAVGRQAQTGQSSTFNVDGDLVARTMLNTQIYDGDGQMVAYILGVTTTVNSNPPSNTAETTYLLRSSAMGGSVVSEYGPNGWKTTHIFAGAERIGEFNKTENGQTRSVWRHVDPVTGDTVNTVVAGTSIGHTTFDPLGVSMGDSDPFPADGSGDNDGLIPNLGLPTDKGGASPIPMEDSGLRCMLDGIMLPCGFIRGQTSVQCPQNDCGPRQVIYQGEKVWAHFQSFVDDYSGFIPATARYTGEGNIAPIGSNDPPKLTGRRRDTNLAMMNGAQDEAVLALRGHQSDYRNTRPRRIGRDERSGLIDDAIALLEKNGCEAALNP